MSNNFKALSSAIMKAARKHGTPDDTATCARVLSSTAQFLAGSCSGDSVAALESLGGDNIPKLNSINVEHDLTVSAIEAFVDECGVRESHRRGVTMEIARILDGGIQRAAIFSNEAPANLKDQISLESAVGGNAMGMLRYEGKVGLEAFGNDIDRLQQDNRLSIVLTVLRSFASIIDKVLPRVAEESNVVALAIPAPEVYDLQASMNASGSVRNSAATRTPLVELYRQPDPVSTQPKPVVPLIANDTGDTKMLDTVNSGAVLVGVTANLFDLSMDTTKIGYGNIDYTDLVAEGGRIKTLFITATNVAGSVTTTETFAVPVQYLPGAVFVQSPNNIDSGDVIVMLQNSTMIRSSSTTNLNAATSMFAGMTDAVIQLDFNFNSGLNLKTGVIHGGGTVTKNLKPLAGKDDTTIGATSKTLFAGTTFTVSSYAPDLYFDEENMRKTAIAVRVNYLERQFVIPMGRNFVVDYSLAQPDDSSVASTVNVVTSLGNSARGLSITTSRLAEVSAALAFAEANPEMASVVQPTRLSIAATLCLPYVVGTSLNYADAKTAVMRESERLTDMHGRFREMILNVLATVCAKSLYLNNLEAGETVVFKVVTYSPIADTIIGILDYHNTLTDKVATANGADYSMQLPNGYRLDIVKTNFVDFEGVMVVIPVREADPTHVTSFGTIRDRGSYVAQYTPINNGGVARRIVTNTREIVFPTNPVGAVIAISGIDNELGTVQPMADVYSLVNTATP